MAANDTTKISGNVAGEARRRAVTAFFEDRAAAQTAIDDLNASGVARSRVTLVEGGPEPVAEEAVPTQHKGFWQGLKDLFMADEDRHAYGEGLRRGGFLVSVDTGGDDHDRIVELLDRDGAIDIDARAADWTLEGWDPIRAAADLRTGTGGGATLDRESQSIAPPVSGASPAAPVAPVPVAPVDPVAAAPSSPVTPVVGEDRPRPASPAPQAAEAAAARIEPQALEPSAAVGPAFGSATPRPAEAGPTAIRDPGALPSRLRTYIEQHVRRDPQDPAG